MLYLFISSIDILKNLVFNQMTFTPIKIYIDVINSFNDEMLSSLIKNSSDKDILDKNKTRYIFDMDNEIIVSNTTKNNELENIDKAIDKLKVQEKKLVDLYLSSNLNVEAINNKNETIKKEVQKLTEKKKLINPSDDYKVCAIDNSEIYKSVRKA